MNESKSNDGSISDYLSSLTNSLDNLENIKKELNNEELPTDIKVMAHAIDPTGKNKLMNFIFDTKLDYTLENMLNKFLNGNYEDVSKYADIIAKLLDAMGIGKDAFKGPVSQALMQNIISTLNTLDFSRAKSNIKKCFMIVGNLKKQASTINNPETRKKYKDAVYALKQMLKYASKIYKQRKLITYRAKAGMHNAINEEMDTTITEDD